MAGFSIPSERPTCREPGQGDVEFFTAGARVRSGTNRRASGL
jgi:hypothetical protein